MTQNTARISCSRRKSSNASVVAPFGPSSKVSAETSPVPAARVTWSVVVTGGS